MRKINITFASMIAISTLGSAFALKAKKEGGNNFKTYAGTTTIINSRVYAVCDNSVTGTILPSSQLGAFYTYYVPVNTTKVCTLGYFTISE